jgi:phosphate transport system protein
MTHSEDIRRHFEEELHNVRLDTVRLGALVLENCKRLGDALIENDLALAREAVDADDEVDQRYSELERRTFRIMATQQPVAGDLRLLMSIVRLLYEIERSGDLVVNSAKGMLRQEGFALSPALHGILARLSEQSALVFGEGLDALRNLEASAGPRLDRIDDLVDDLVEEYYSQLASDHEEAPDMHLDTVIELSRVGRYLERIADHGVNIGDHVTFIVTGSFPRHSVEAAADED